MDIVKFFELIKQYTNIKSDQDLFDAFFLCFDESGLIKRKNEYLITLSVKKQAEFFFYHQCIY